MLCTNCGAEVADDCKFCTHCGQKIEKVDSEKLNQAESDEVSNDAESDSAESAKPEDAAVTLADVVAEEPQAECGVAEAAVPETTSLTPVAEIKETTETPAELATTITADGNEVTVLEPKRKRNARTITIACTVVICLVVVTLGGLLCWKSLTPKELLLNSSDIKDDAVNTMLVQYDKDGDGKLSEEELGDVEEVEIGEDVTDASFLKYLWNLRYLTVNSPNLSYIDLTNNENLTGADFRNATGTRQFNLPPLDDYSDFRFPPIDDFPPIIIPGNPEYETQWVPSDVTEVVSLAGSDEVESREIEQDVSSVNQVNSLTVKKENNEFSQDWEYDFSYDDFCRLQTTDLTDTYVSKSKSSVSNSVKTLSYNSQNKVSLLVDKPGSNTTGTASTNPVSYTEDGLVSQVGKSYSVDYNGQNIELKTKSGRKENTETSWTVSEEKTSIFIESNAEDGYLLKHDYEFDDNNKCVKETLDAYSTKNSSIKDGDVKGNISDSTEVKYTYDGDKLVKAEFSNGFVQNYEYDSRDLLVDITSEGDAPTIDGADIATNCHIKYDCLITKKGQKALSFITLPGNENSTTVGLTTSIREIDPTLTSNLSSAVQNANFTGKFWWDEEGILDRQVEASGKELPQEDDDAEITLLSVDPNDEAHEAYQSKIEEYAKYNGLSQNEVYKSIKGMSEDDGINFAALTDFGTNFGYAYYDLNDDGIDELLINSSSSSGTKDVILDAFTFQNGEVKRILYSYSSRSFYTLKKNGYLCQYISGGITVNRWVISRFDGDFTFVEDNGGKSIANQNCLLQYGSDSSDPSKYDYYKIENEGLKQRLTEKEYKSFEREIDAKYEDETIDWISVS